MVFFSNRGISLAGILVSMGLLAIIALTSLTVFNTNMYQQKHVQQLYAVNNLQSEIYQQLSNPVSCKNTFATLNRDDIDNPPSESFPISVIKDVDNVANAFENYSVSNKVYSGGLIRIDSMILKNYKDQGIDVSTGRYLATAYLDIIFKKDSTSIGSDSFRVRNIKIQFRFFKNPPDAQPDKTVDFCSAIGGANESFWALTSSGDGIYYSGGKVGVGVNSPIATFEVAGNIKIGNSGAGITCDATTEGSLRYNSAQKIMEYCSTFSAGVWSWQPLTPSFKTVEVNCQCGDITPGGSAGCDSCDKWPASCTLGVNDPPLGDRCDWHSTTTVTCPAGYTAFSASGNVSGTDETISSLVLNSTTVRCRSQSFHRSGQMNTTCQAICVKGNVRIDP